MHDVSSHLLVVRFGDRVEFGVRQSGLLENGRDELVAEGLEVSFVLDMNGQEVVEFTNAESVRCLVDNRLVAAAQYQILPIWRGRKVAHRVAACRSEHEGARATMDVYHAVNVSNAFVLLRRDEENIDTTILVTAVVAKSGIASAESPRGSWAFGENVKAEKISTGTFVEGIVGRRDQSGFLGGRDRQGEKTRVVWLGHTCFCAR